MSRTLIASAVEDVIGTVTPPTGVTQYDADANDGIGLLVFISNLITVMTVVAGLWVMFNFILAGYEYITSSGDSGAHGKVRERLTMSVIGLVLIVAAYGIVALLGLLFTGNAGYFVNPVIPQPGQG